MLTNPLFIKTSKGTLLINELKKHLNDLIAHRAQPSVSIYMPVEVPGKQVRKNAIRLKNLIKEARSLCSEDTTDLLAPLERLTQNDDASWAHYSPGIAIFHSPTATGMYTLPTSVSPLVTVEDRFHLKPILRLLGEPSRFYVLALSRNETRLLEADRWGVSRVSTAMLPTSLEESTPSRDVEKHVQLNASATYHGQGGGEQRSQEDLRRFLAAIDSGLSETIRRSHGPLVLAGVSELTAKFREMSRHDIVSQDVDGNVENVSDHELWQRAQNLARPHLLKVHQRAKARIENLHHTGYVTSSVDTIVGAAVDGRVDTLFVEDGTHQWGGFSPSKRLVSMDDAQTNRNEDLLDLAAIRTYEMGGDVFVVKSEQMPVDGAKATAILRY